MRVIRRIIMHCSASGYGTEALIDDWHKARGWKGDGYHAVILNGRPYNPKEYVEALDGQIEWGRSLEEVGAHCKGHNYDSIGICLIGEGRGSGDFTPLQLTSAVALCVDLMSEFGLVKEQVFGHRDFNPRKACPGFETEWFRGLLPG